MKKIILVGIFSITASSVFANENAKNNVLIEKKTTVLFAPQQFVGTYSFQILSDGAMQYIDNKNKVTDFGKLSQTAVNKIENSLKTIEDFTLTKADGPECMDAPSKEVVAHIADKSVTIWKNQNCKDYTPTDPKAAMLSTCLNTLSKAYDDLY